MTTSNDPEAHAFLTLGSSTAIALYADTFEEEGARIYIQRSTDSGASWQAPQRLGDVFVGWGGAIAGSGTDVDVVWTEATNTASVLHYRHSSDSGATFPAPIDLATGPGGPIHVPNVARRGDVVAVIWLDTPNLVRIRISTNGGFAFGPVTELATHSTTYVGVPVVAVGNGVIYAAYFADDTHVNMRRSLDNGTTWEPAVELAADATRDISDGIVLTASARHAYLAYAAKSGASKWIRYRRTIDRGASWSAASDLSSPSGNESRDPSIDLNSGVVRVAYTECLISNCNRAVVKYRESSNGTTWTTPEIASLTTTRWASAEGVGFAGRVIVLYTAQHGRSAYTCACDLYVSTK